jgi:8-oxo-dGTP pyrophosphatase MutT (NUDIX family)
MKLRRQAGAIPFRIKNKKVRYLLVTTNQGSWIFPKGGIEQGDSERETASKECMEEAGVIGKVGKRIGSYTKKKSPAEVTLYLLNYKKATKWQERHRRRRRWCSYKVARALLTDSQRRLLDKAQQELAQYT